VTATPWSADEFTTAVTTLGLPRWTRFAYAAIPVVAGVATVVSDTSTLPIALQVALLVVSIAPFMIEGLAKSRTDFIIRLVSFFAIAPLIVTGADRVVLWIPGFILNRNIAFGTNAVRAWSVACTGALLVLASVTEPHLDNAPLVLIGFGASLLAGLATLQIVRLVSHLRETEQLLALEAARAERRRFAREVHDVIAHSMTVTLLHLQAARLACRTAPEDAESALGEAERVGRASLDDLRRTVRLLSDETGTTLDGSTEAFETLKELVDGFTLAGADVHLNVSSDLSDVPPVIAQALYRIVQESITNAVRHSPGSRVDVDITTGPTRTTMRIDNGLGTSQFASNRERPRGQGLRGMIERAALLGGHLEAGPTKDGWRVVGWLPSEPPLPGMES